MTASDTPRDQATRRARVFFDKGRAFLRAAEEAEGGDLMVEIHILATAARMLVEADRLLGDQTPDMQELGRHNVLVRRTLEADPDMAISSEMMDDIRMGLDAVLRQVSIRLEAGEPLRLRPRAVPRLMN